MALARNAGAARMSSQQRAWWPVHEFITALVQQCGAALPPAGTPEWCELADGDPRKLLALALDGEHHVLRVETAQMARAEASREIAAAANWTAMATRIRNRDNTYIPRRKGAA